MLEVSEKAVESLLVRARRSLREAARRRLGEEE
jgi:DNA-directed RNA polymerase specialized sigma24 family protein